MCGGMSPSSNVSGLCSSSRTRLKKNHNPFKRGPTDHGLFFSVRHTYIFCYFSRRFCAVHQSRIVTVHYYYYSTVETHTPAKQRYSINNTIALNSTRRYTVCTVVSYTGYKHALWKSLPRAVRIVRTFIYTVFIYYDYIVFWLILRWKFIIYRPPSMLQHNKKKNDYVFEIFFF